MQSAKSDEILVNVIVSQGTELPSKEIIEQGWQDRTIIVQNENKRDREKVINKLDNETKRVISQNCEKATSSRLTILLKKDQSFV